MTEQSPAGVPGTASAPRDFTVLSGNPTPDELAALTAVLVAAIGEAQHSDERHPKRGRNGWERAQRPIRMPLSRGEGAWRSFGN